MTTLRAHPACSHDDYLTRKRFLNLDGLRFICILMVLWHHSPQIDGQWQMFSRGFQGVSFFFVLSGYLITTLLLRERAREGTFSLKNFYIRRAIRIIPIYYFVVSIVVVYHIVLKGRTDYLEMVPYYYLFLSNFLVGDIPLLGPTWSLSVEEQFYVVWPLLLLLVPARWIVPLAVTLIVVSVAGRLGLFGLDPVTPGPLKIDLPPSTYVPLILGAVLAILLQRPAGFAALSRLLGGRWSFVVLMLGIALCFQLLPQDLSGLPNLLIQMLMAGALCALVLREDGVLSGFLQQGFIVRFGMVSYGVYLYHLLVLDVVNRVLPGGWGENTFVILIVYSLLSYVVAEISFRTLESYFHRFRPKG